MPTNNQGKLQWKKMAAELEYSIMVPRHHHPVPNFKIEFQYLPTCEYVFEKILQSVREKLKNIKDKNKPFFFAPKKSLQVKVTLDSPDLHHNTTGELYGCLLFR